MKKLMKKRKHLKRLVSLGACIIMTITLTGSPGVQVAKAGDDPAYNTQTQAKPGRTAEMPVQDTNGDAKGLPTSQKAASDTDIAVGEEDAADQGKMAQGEQSGQASAQSMEDQSKPDVSGQTQADQGKPDGSGQTQAGQSKPDESVQTQDGQNKPDSGNQTQEGQDKPDGSGQTQEGQNKPDSGNQTQEGQSKPGGSGQTQEGQNKPDSGNQTQEGQDKPGGSGQTQEGQNKPDSGNQTQEGQSKPDGSGQSQPDEIVQNTKPGFVLKAGDAADKNAASNKLKKEDKAEAPEARDRAGEIRLAVGAILPYDISKGTIEITDSATSGKLKVKQTRVGGEATTNEISATDSLTVTGQYFAQEIEKNDCYNIVVDAPSAANGVNITLNGINMSTYTTYYGISQKPALDIRGKTKVNLNLAGSNHLLTTGGNVACVQVPAEATLIIDGEGSLAAEVKNAIKESTSMTTGAAIGSKWGPAEHPEEGDSGNIIIKGGNIIARGGNGPAIGAGRNGVARNITIEGGTVTTTAVGTGAAAIGNGGTYNKYPELAARSVLQNITITGGNVNVTTNGGVVAGIGGGFYGGGGNIAITGGFVYMHGSAKNAIGPGYLDSNQKTVEKFTTKRTDSQGNRIDNPIIVMGNPGKNSGYIYDHTHESEWQGVIFEATEGHVYGVPDIDQSFTIYPGYTLYINEGQGITNHNTGVVITLQGTMINNGIMDGNLHLLVANGGLAENHSQATNRGIIEIQAGGTFKNGTASDRGKALFDNAPGSHLIVNGTIENYASITGPTAESTFLSGTGVVWCLPNIKVKVLKNGAVVPPAGGVVPLVYKDSITLNAAVTGPLYPNVGEYWVPTAAGQVRYNLINGTQVSYFGEGTIDGQKSTFDFPPVNTVVGQGALSWEGDKELALGASLLTKIGGGTAVGGKPSVGYMPSTSVAAVRYEKLDPGVTAWPTASAVTDGDTLAKSTLTGGTCAQPGHFQWHDSTTEAVWRADGQTFYPVDFLPDDPANYKTASKDVLVPVNAVPRNVYYDPQGGSFKDMTPGEKIQKVAKNRLPLTPAMMPAKEQGPFKDSAKFMGWYKDAQCTQPWVMADPVTSDMTLYAGYATTDPSVGFMIPASVPMTNNPATGNAEGKCSIQVKPIASPNGGMVHPASVAVTTASDVHLMGTRGLTRTAQVYREDGSLYDGGSALMTFTFKDVPVESEKHSFLLKMSMDDPERLADKYSGHLILTFDTKTE